MYLIGVISVVRCRSFWCSELSAAQLGKSCAGEHGANMETEEIDERDPKFIRKETEVAVERAYDQIAKDQASFATLGKI